MDVMIGQTATISSIRSGGIGLKSGYSYPFFVLEKVEPNQNQTHFNFLMLMQRGSNLLMVLGGSNSTKS